MLYLNIHLTVTDPADIDSIRGHLGEAARLSRQEPGCKRFDVYQSQREPSRFFLCEWWESQAALDEHRKGVPYTQIYQPQILPKVTREPHPSDLVA